MNVSKIFLTGIIVLLSICGVYAQKKSLNVGEIFPAPGKGHNQYIISENGQCKLIFNSGKFCTFKVDQKEMPNYNNAIACFGKPHYPNMTLRLQPDGNLVIISGKAHTPDVIVWGSSTISEHDPRFKNTALKPVQLRVENDGTIALYSASNEKVWVHTIKQ